VGLVGRFGGQHFLIFTLTTLLVIDAPLLVRCFLEQETFLPRAKEKREETRRVNAILGLATSITYNHLNMFPEIPDIFPKYVAFFLVKTF